MQIVLKKDVAKFGLRGDVKKVKSGYFRNYLFPNGLAEVATKARLKGFEELLKQKAIKRERLAKEAKDIIKKFEGLTLTFNLKASAKGKLYAALTEKHIVDAVLDQVKVEIGEENILMPHLKDIGEHEITVKLAEGVQTKITVNICGKGKF